MYVANGVANRPRPCKAGVCFTGATGASRSAGLSWKGTLVRRLITLVLLLPLLLLSACSDDGESANPSPTPTLAVVATATTEAPDPTGAATEAAIEGTVIVDFTGAPEELDRIESEFSVEPGASGLDAVEAAIGEENLSVQDFGGDLGVFVTGFSGVEAQGNHFWEFRLNGESSQVGLSKYEVQPGDVIEFVYSSF